MNKRSILIFFLVVMVILNMTLLAFIVLSSPRLSNRITRPGVKDMKFIQEEFGLTDKQLIKLENSKYVHIEVTKELNDKIRKSSIDYYKYVGDPAVKDSLLQVVISQNRSFYLINDMHINELRALCSPDKQHELERFIIAQFNNRGNNGPPRLPRDRPR